MVRDLGNRINVRPAMITVQCSTNGPVAAGEAEVAAVAAEVTVAAMIAAKVCWAADVGTVGAVEVVL